MTAILHQLMAAPLYNSTRDYAPASLANRVYMRFIGWMALNLSLLGLDGSKPLPAVCYSAFIAITSWDNNLVISAPNLSRAVRVQT